MTDQHSLTSDDLIDRLRRYAEQNKSEPWIPVKATELITLLDHIATLEAKCDRLADTAMARGDR